MKIRPGNCSMNEAAMKVTHSSLLAPIREPLPDWEIRLTFRKEEERSVLSSRSAVARYSLLLTRHGIGFSNRIFAHLGE